MRVTSHQLLLACRRLFPSYEVDDVLNIQGSKEFFRSAATRIETEGAAVQSETPAESKIGQALQRLKRRMRGAMKIGGILSLCAPKEPSSRSDQHLDSVK